jgi:hypothetical protein
MADNGQKCKAIFNNNNEACDNTHWDYQFLYYFYESWFLYECKYKNIIDIIKVNLGNQCNFEIM